VPGVRLLCKTALSWRPGLANPPGQVRGWWLGSQSSSQGWSPPGSRLFLSITMWPCSRSCSTPISALDWQPEVAAGRAELPSVIGEHWLMRLPMVAEGAAARVWGRPLESLQSQARHWATAFAVRSRPTSWVSRLRGLRTPSEGEGRAAPREPPLAGLSGDSAPRTPGEAPRPKPHSSLFLLCFLSPGRAFLKSP